MEQKARIYQDLDRILVTKEEIDRKVKELGKRITADYAGKEPVLVCILKGAVYFFTDLTRKLDIDCELDFMRISSYKGKKSTGKVKIIVDISSNIKDRDVIIVEDIIDTGKTITGLYNHLLAKEPRSIKLCVLLDKPERREEFDIEPDYTGFVIPNRFVIGYGLDEDEKYRTIPHISCITDNEKQVENDREVIKKQLIIRKNSLH